MIGPTNLLPADGPVVLAWGSAEPHRGRDRGPDSRATSATSSTTCPRAWRSAARTTFRSDLVRSTVIEGDAVLFSQGATRPSSSGAARPRSPTARSRSRHDRGDRADDRAQLPTRAAVEPVAVSSRSHRSRRPAPTRRPRNAIRRVRRRPAEVEVFDVEARDVAAPAAPRVRDAVRGRRSGPIRRPDARARSSSATSTSGATASASRRRVDQRRRAMSAIVRTEGLVKRYDRTVAVAGIDLAIERGEIFGLVGPTAPARRPRCGSSPRSCGHDAGDAEIDGWSVTRNPDEVRRVLGFMPDAFGVYDDMKVWEYLDFFARCYGLPAAGRRRMIARPARAGRSRRQARRLRPDPVARHAAAPLPGPRPRPRPAGPAARRAGIRASIRARGSSFASSSASCVRWARRSSSAATSCPSSRSCAPAWRSSIAARSSPRAASRTSNDGSGSGPSCASVSCSTATTWWPRAIGSPPQPDVASATVLDDGTIELGFRGDDAASARLLADSVAAGLPVVSFARAASDLEELFLQVTARDVAPDRSGLRYRR